MRDLDLYMQNTTKLINTKPNHNIIEDKKTKLKNDIREASELVFLNDNDEALKKLKKIMETL